ncbi:YisL family protein [Staphylococcus sp. IVB6181]|uniref:YisL family protein n=1 Tax=Staphylococcus sp. IVB6181 TaxID=2929481 RepID=UPI0021D0127B|nr:YisL family protein [Staphylococcus sp. IVB6181]UXV34421.1 YisL family protein [Staphylococcus sp. IVB6181]
MLHLHIFSWVIGIILFIAAYLSFTSSGAPKKAYKPLHMALRLFLLLILFSGVWQIVVEFATATGSAHMLLTLKMVCGVAVVALMETTLIRKQRGQSHNRLFWGVIVLIIITMALGIILPEGPISSMFGIGQ